MNFRSIPLDTVKPSPMNPRKTFDEEAVRELAANIEKQGLIQPITVRTNPHAEGFEIVCGERRYRAFCLLKVREDEINVAQTAAHRKKYDRFQSIPAIIREMTDEEALETMITENLQRQDVDPMEEAFAFGQLIKNGRTVEEVALKFGKSIRFIQDRCKLNSLIPELMVAVKEEKMSIAAAMIICKLDEDGQRKYANSYSANINGYSKSSAESFINSLFMSIQKSPWYQSDNQADEDFDGGCGRKCSECTFNTANHGCLFWEMKSQDAGRCTNRDNFTCKQAEYIIRSVEEYADRLVKAGNPLESGKMVIIHQETYCSEPTKQLKKEVFKRLKALGYEVLKYDDVFQNKVYYEDDDPRVETMLKKGECYPCLSLFNYDSVKVEVEYHRIKTTKQATADGASGISATSIDAMKLVEKYKRGQEIMKEKIGERMRKFCDTDQIKAYAADGSNPLSSDEEIAMLAIILARMTDWRCEERNEFYNILDGNKMSYLRDTPGIRNIIIRQALREYMKTNIDGLADWLHFTILSQWDKNECQLMRDQEEETARVKLEKIAGKLKDLGYKTDGTLIK
ncbi:chromosome partitioning protein ParB [Muribaculaceae bacterium Isolate-007 (NCI)]|nr:chromosome partitioning protein ParB [Muribaculaceae bacterium Isolate-100 (HZI)]RXE66265.1 chromosome partitioning protein ParB [Muribaculaceae bacterium Isolate-007 (NCI)]